MKKRFLTYLVKPSTQAFNNEARNTPNYGWSDWVHGQIYARWPYLYISIGVGEHPIAKWLGPVANYVTKALQRHNSSNKKEMSFENSPAVHIKSQRGGSSFADTYHGKVVPLEPAKKLVTVNEPIQLKNLEQIIPYKRARDIVLKNPDHIAVLECPCRSARSNPCLPLDVCLIIGEPFASFVIEHHPQRARWISPAEAVEILQAEDDRGHVHHAFFKDAMLNRFYAICNCCGCCCGAMQAKRNGTPMLASSGFVAQIDEEWCTGCGLCSEFCQFGALSVPEDIAFVHTEDCMGCGICTSKCDMEAITLVRAPEKGEPLDICALMTMADVI